MFRLIYGAPKPIIRCTFLSNISSKNGEMKILFPFTAMVGLEDAKLERFFFKRFLLLLLLFLLLIPVFFLSIAGGVYSLSLGDIIKCLLNPYDENPSSITHTVVWFYRVPRTLGALIAGAVLAVAGALIQGITRNPLASPFTLGISSAASFGAGLVIVLGLKLALVSREFLATSSGYVVVALTAWTICFLHTLFILMLIYVKGFSPESIVLAGIAMTYVYSAGITFLQYFAGESALREYVYWIMGDITRVDWSKLWVLIAALAVVGVSAPFYAWGLNTLALGDDVAKSLGIDPKRMRFAIALIASIATATVICVTGPIAFVCLMAPHIARLMIGSDNRYLLPASMAVGAMILTLSDVVARIALKPVELPVGAVTSALGAAFFISLYMGRRRQVVMG
jgi:iron complex transport system permease protein